MNKYQLTTIDITSNKKPYDIVRNPDRNKRLFLNARLLASSADIITIILLVIILLNYLKPILYSKSSDIIEIFDYDIDNNSIRNKTNLVFSISDNYAFNKTIFNTHPIKEKLLVLYDNINYNKQNAIFLYINIIWKIISFILYYKYI